MHFGGNTTEAKLCAVQVHYIRRHMKCQYNIGSVIFDQFFNMISISFSTAKLLSFVSFVIKKLYMGKDFENIFCIILLINFSITLMVF